MLRPVVDHGHGAGDLLCRRDDRISECRGIRIFDYPEFAKTLRDRVRDRAATLAAEAGITIEHLAKPHIRKEDVVARVLRQRGDRPGLVHVISAMEACDMSQALARQADPRTFIRPDSGEYLHCYFYFQDATFGLVYLRVPTWAAPFTPAGSTATAIASWRASCPRRASATPWPTMRSCTSTTGRLPRPWPTHCRLTSCTARWIGMPSCIARYLMCSGSPIVEPDAGGIRHRSGVPLHRHPRPAAEQLVRQSVLNVKAEQVATFLGRQITPSLAQEIGSQFATRIEGTCIKHRFGKCSIKMYDKHGIVLRIETTTNDVSFFKHHRRVEHRKGPAGRELAPVKKSIYSLIDLRDILLGCNRRYIAHLSALDDFSAGIRALGRLTRPREVDGKTVRGINFFAPADKALLHALQNPRVNIAGIRRSQLLPHLGMFSPTRLSRHLRRLLDLGVIKRVTGTYRYYLTKAGRAATPAAAEQVTKAVIVPANKFDRI